MNNATHCTAPEALTAHYSISGKPATRAGVLAAINAAGMPVSLDKAQRLARAEELRHFFTTYAGARLDTIVMLEWSRACAAPDALMQSSLEQVEQGYRAGTVTQDDFEAYTCAWRRSAVRYSTLYAGTCARCGTPDPNEEHGPYYIVDDRGYAAQVYKPLAGDPFTPWPNTGRRSAQRRADEMTANDGVDYTVTRVLPPMDPSEELY